MFKGKKVLILGLGLNQGGTGAAKFFAQSGAKVRVTDLKDAKTLKTSINQLKRFRNIKYILGKHRYEDIDWADLIIRNPALKPDNPYLKYARQKGKKIETDMGIFLQLVKPEQIIGVTGTKGKSTTASLIYEVLKNCKEGVLFAGNIGKSVLDTVELIQTSTLVVLEISSFQLEAFNEHKVAPKFAVLTNIYPDHLNYYKSMNDYIQSKRLIFKYQQRADFLFIRTGDEATDKPGFLKGLTGKKIYFSPKDLPKNFKPFLGGEHNKENMAAALAIAKTFSFDHKKVLKVLKGFKGVEFRLQKIYDKKGIKIYNDSAATNPNAAIEALKSFPNSILITGGVNKNLDYRDFAKAIEKYAKAVYFLEGDATDIIISNLKTIHPLREQILNLVGIYNDLEKLLQDVKKNIHAGDIILFSPGAASFNLFQNEFDRGRKFNQAVAKVFKIN